MLLCCFIPPTKQKQCTTEITFLACVPICVQWVGVGAVLGRMHTPLKRERLKSCTVARIFVVAIKVVVVVAVHCRTVRVVVVVVGDLSTMVVKATDSARAHALAC